jgi:hypothetical protein
MEVLVRKVARVLVKALVHEEAPWHGTLASGMTGNRWTEPMIYSAGAHSDVVRAVR